MSRKIFCWSFVFVFCLSFSFENAYGRLENKPLWELGVFGGMFNLPDYPGANENRFRTLILPFYVYRGEVIRAGDGSIVKGRFFNSDRIKLDMSASAAFPVDSQSNQTRSDMPDLDWIGELGPQLVYHFLPYSKIVELDLKLPIRAVVSTDFGRLDDRGFMFNPRIDLVHRAFFDEDVKFYLRFGAEYGTLKLMKYLYEVQPQHMTSNRPVYKAKAGLLRSSIGFGVAHKFSKNLRFFSGIQRHFYDHASNLDSPIHKNKTNTTMIIGMVWSGLQSKKRAFKD